MDAKERSLAIIDYLNLHESAGVTELSEAFQVSEMTIRRDLNQLEKDKIVIRVHGGAKLLSDMKEASAHDRIITQAEEKSRLGAFAVSLIEAGDTIALDDSSTTLAMIPFLRVPVTVITNHIQVATALAENELAEVVLIGGHLRKKSLSFTGAMMEDYLKQFQVDKAFLSAKSCGIEKGIFDASIDEAHSKKIFMECARKTYFLFDHTKIGQRSFHKVCGINQTDGIITDVYEGNTALLEELEQYCSNEHIDFYAV